MQDTTSRPSSMACCIIASEERKGVHLQLHCPLGQAQELPQLQPQSPISEVMVSWVDRYGEMVLVSIPIFDDFVE